MQISVIKGDTVLLRANIVYSRSNDQRHAKIDCILIIQKQKKDKFCSSKKTNKILICSILTHILMLHMIT